MKTELNITADVANWAYYIEDRVKALWLFLVWSLFTFSWQKLPSKYILTKIVIARTYILNSLLYVYKFPLLQ